MWAEAKSVGLLFEKRFHGVLVAKDGLNCEIFYTVVFAAPMRRRGKVLFRKAYKVIRFWFDNSISRKGSLAFWTIVAASAAVGIGVIAQEVVLPKVSGDELENFGPVTQGFWAGVERALGRPGATGATEALIDFWFWFVGMMILGTIFAWRTSALEGLKARILAGRTPVLLSGHFAVLGWSQLAKSLVREVAESNNTSRRFPVVILAQSDRYLIERELNEYLTSLGLEGKVRLVVRTGDPVSVNDLARIALSKAKAVEVVEPEAEASSLRVPAVVLAAFRFGLGEGVTIVAESRSRDVTRLLKATKAPVFAVASSSTIAEFAAQSARHPSIIHGLLELLNFSGSEIYAKPSTGFEGTTFGDAQKRISHGTLVGTSQGADLMLNPPVGHVIAESTELLVAAENIMEAQRSLLKDSVPGKFGNVDLHPTDDAAKVVCIVGNSELAQAVARSLLVFLSAASSVVLISESGPAESMGEYAENFEHLICPNLLSPRVGDLIPDSVDEIVLIGNPNGAGSLDEADAKTALTLQLIRLAAARRGLAPRFTVEILNPSNRTLIEEASGDEVVIGDEIVAMVMAQGMQDPRIGKILLDLANPTWGSALNAYDVADRAEVQFGDLVEAGQKLGVTIVG